MNKVKINPNTIIANCARDAIAQNDGYCPCKIGHTDENKCMCEQFRQQIQDEQNCVCDCGLYVSYQDYPIICLCGSTKFKEKFFEMARYFTKLNYIVVMPLVFGHSGDELTPEEKENLDNIHKAKINMADVVFVINVDGYIGESTRKEIEYALTIGKSVEYLEETK